MATHPKKKKTKKAPDPKKLGAKTDAPKATPKETPPEAIPPVILSPEQHADFAAIMDQMEAVKNEMIPRMDRLSRNRARIFQEALREAGSTRPLGDYRWACNEDGTSTRLFVPEPEKPA